MKYVLVSLLALISFFTRGQSTHLTTDNLQITIQTAQSGNWTDADTWAGGAVPGTTDNVVINPGHIVNINASVTSGNIQVSTGGVLQLISLDTLKMGTAGGGLALLQVEGSLVLINGMLELNGRLFCAPNAVFNMSGGLLRVDGNNGSSTGSIPNGNDIVKFSAGMQEFQFTGGVMNIVDPPFGNSGSALNSAYDFGPQSTLRLGDSIGSNAGASSYGFGSLMPSQIGHLSIYYCQGSGVSHYFKLLHPLTVQGNCTIEKGYYIQPDFWGQSSCMLRANLFVKGNLHVANSMTLGVMDTTIVSANLRILGDLEIDSFIAFKSISSSAISINGDIINQGMFEIPDLYMAYDFGLVPSSTVQYLKGSGQYLGFASANLFINNSSNESVRIHPDFSNYGDSTLYLRTLQFIQGKFYAGNKTVDIYWNMTGGSPVKYLVLDTGGILIDEGQSVLAYIGTNDFYNPVSINQASANKYAIKLRPLSLFQAATSGIGCEWEISLLQGQTFPVAISFQWQGVQEENGFTRNACYVSRYNGNVWQKISPVQAASGSDPYQITINGLTELSRFTVQSGGILPVHLLSFTAALENENVLVKWISADEINFAQFELERRTGQEKFIRIATIPSRQETGNNIYSFLDRPTNKGEVYYRLKMVDRDGTYVYSFIISVAIPTIPIMLFPNPVKALLHVKGVADFDLLTITDMNGRILVRRSTSNNLENIDVSLLPAGIYQLNLFGKDFSRILIFMKE